jgi:hypothetical protein
MADVVFFSISALSNFTSSHVQEIYHLDGGGEETDGTISMRNFFYDENAQNSFYVSENVLEIKYGQL